MTNSAQTKFTTRQEFLLRVGDNCLILGQRLGEWCGHGPVLEQDIALTNIALDLIGQARSWLTLAGGTISPVKSEDEMAFLRDAWDFRNVLLVEQPNSDFAHTIVRQFCFDAFHALILTQLTTSNDEEVAAIAEKALKEVTYHLRYSSEWMIRLGDGTEESHQRMQQALDNLWMYTGELTTANEMDRQIAAAGFGPDPAIFQRPWKKKVEAILHLATLDLPEDHWMQSGGKKGIHTEHFGYILADLQFLQRAYPGMTW